MRPGVERTLRGYGLLLVFMFVGLVVLAFLVWIFGVAGDRRSHQLELPEGLEPGDGDPDEA